LIVVALIATGFFSFGLWVHHMFTTGIPNLTLAFFSAASMAVAVPSGIQVFAWIATLAKSKGRIELSTPALFVLGMLFIFTIGGLTGVMVAMVPFDWQAHDSYFIVAHLHYVLIGGMVFPLFATFYYWAPMLSRRRLSDRLGKWAFGCMFIGFNVAFFPLHIVGLAGMPRRVWTYAEELGVGPLNLISTFGAYVLAAGVLIFIVDLVLNFRVGEEGEDNPWRAGTLEWLPGDVYSTRSIPHVYSREPLWTHPDLPDEVERGEHYLPDAPTGGRETLVTSAIEARPEYVVRMPGPSWTHVAAAVFTAACFLLLTVKLLVPAVLCALGAIGSCIAWVWQIDKGPGHGEVDIGHGIRVPTYMTGPSGHGWWAMVILMFVAGSLFLAYLFSYLYLWTVAPQVWSGPEDSPALAWPASSLVAYVLAVLAFGYAQRCLASDRTARVPWLAGLAALFAVLGVGLELAGHWESGLRPTGSSYAALVYMASVLNGQLVLAVVIMSGFTMARYWAGKLHATRNACLENTGLLLYYTAAQAVVALMVVHGFVRFAA
jgi:cytochrome c oxidase subunit I+III